MQAGLLVDDLPRHHGGAVLVATQIVRQPNLVRMVRASQLPNGMTLLLEIAAGDAQAIEQGQRLTGWATAELIHAAGFFMEQILFTERASYYRVLGAYRTMSQADLRYHMTLLMRWIHPDARPADSLNRVDRSVFITRITAAWETLKSTERRLAYDTSLAPVGSSPSAPRSTRHSKLALRPIKKEGLISRLLQFLHGGR